MIMRATLEVDDLHSFADSLEGIADVFRPSPFLNVLCVQVSVTSFWLT